MTPEDIHSLLEPARGWLELGAWLAANEELEDLSPELRAHPEVLKLRCQIYTAAKDLDEPRRPDFGGGLHVCLQDAVPPGAVRRYYRVVTP